MKCQSLLLQEAWSHWEVGGVGQEAGQAVPLSPPPIEEVSLLWLHIPRAEAAACSPVHATPDRFYSHKEEANGWVDCVVLAKQGWGGNAGGWETAHQKRNSTP